MSNAPIGRVVDVAALQRLCAGDPEKLAEVGESLIKAGAGMVEGAQKAAKIRDRGKSRQPDPADKGTPTLADEYDIHGRRKRGYHK